MNIVIRCVATTLLALLSVNAQEASVSFTGPRSLMIALSEIQKATGTPISYEEPPYENAADLIQTTPGSHPGLRPMIVARTSPNAVVVPLPGLGTPSDPAIFVEAVLAAYHKAGLPGRYKVVRRQNGIDLVPTGIAGLNGVMKTIAPIMSRPVAFPYAERSVVETLQLVVDAMSKAAGREVKLLMTPFTSGMPARIALSASGSSIADALSHLATKTGIGEVSYLLAFDPNDNSYYLTVTGVSPDHPTGPGRREPNPTAAENPFFIKTKP